MGQSQPTSTDTHSKVEQIVWHKWYSAWNRKAEKGFPNLKLPEIQILKKANQGYQ